MQTVENSRIRVTVTDDVWNSYAKRAKRLARMQKSSVEAVQRGLVLSDAMDILGNREELKALDAEAEELRSGEAVLREAKRILIYEYILEHGDRPEKLFLRYDKGLTMSASQERTVEEARAYAEGIIAPSRKSVSDALGHYFRKTQGLSRGQTLREDNRQIRLFQLRQGQGDQDLEAVINRAFDNLHGRERRYRTARSRMEGWEIEVVGDLPVSIGVCRSAYSVADAAQELGVSERRIRQMIHDDVLSGAVKRGNSWAIPLTAIESARRRTPGRPRKVK